MRNKYDYWTVWYFDYHFCGGKAVRGYHMVLVAGAASGMASHSGIYRTHADSDIDCNT